MAMFLDPIKVALFGKQDFTVRELREGTGPRKFKIPPAFSFKGSRGVPTMGFGGAGSFGAGSTAGMKMGMTTEFDFNPTIFMIQKGLREATSSKHIGRPLWMSINRVMIPSIKQNFDKGGRPQQWKPLRVRTMIMRSRAGYNQAGPILKRSGNLKGTALAKARWSVDPVKGQAVYGKFPARAWYASIHQGGYVGWYGSAFAGAQPIPPRPFAVIQEQDLDDMVEIFRGWLSQQFDKKMAKATIR